MDDDKKKRRYVSEESKKLENRGFMSCFLDFVTFIVLNIILWVIVDLQDFTIPQAIFFHGLAICGSFFATLILANFINKITGYKDEDKLSKEYDKKHKE